MKFPCVAGMTNMLTQPYINSFVTENKTIYKCCDVHMLNSACVGHWSGTGARPTITANVPRRQQVTQSDDNSSPRLQDDDLQLPPSGDGK